MSVASSDDATPDPATPRSKRRSWYFLVFIVLILGGADQGSKHWASTTLRSHHRGSLVLYRSKPLTAALTYVRNPGAAWGFLAQSSERFRRPFFITLSVVSIVFILYLFARLRARQHFLTIAFALILAGALGNFADRLHLGYVVDFIDLSIGRLRWATFNIADVAITTGVIMIFLEMIVATLREHRSRHRHT